MAPDEMTSNMKVFTIFVLLLLAAPVMAQNPAVCGTLATGATNANRAITIPPHYSTTQSKPGSMAVTASGCVRSSNVVTCTLTAAPPSPGLTVGGNVVVAGMANATFDGTFTITALPTSTQVRWSQAAGDATTDTGTISSALLPEIAAGGSYVDPSFGCTITEPYADASYPGGGNVHPEYATDFYFSKNHTYLALRGIDSGGWFFTKCTAGTWANACAGAGATTVCYSVGIGNSEEFKWSRTDDTLGYFRESAVLKSIDMDSCVSTNSTAGISTVKSFSASYSNTSLGGTEGGPQLIGGRTRLPIVATGGTAGANTHIFYYEPEADVTGTAYVATGTPVDNCHILPTSGNIVCRYNTDGSGEFQGVALINAAGTFNRHIINDGSHGDVGTDGTSEYWLWDDNANDGNPTSGIGFKSTKVSDSSTVTVWDKTIASQSAGTAFNLGGNVGCAGIWCVLTIDDSATNVGNACETIRGAAWDTNWDRGSDEIILVKADGSAISGSDTAIRLANGRSGNHCPSLVYWKATRASLSPLLSTDGATEVPSYVLFHSDQRLSQGDGERAEPKIIALRSQSLVPTLSAVTPNSGTQGTSPAVALTGTNFDGGNASVSVSGSGVTPTSCVVTNATTIDCASFTIAAGATTGARTVTVTTNEGTSGTQTFTVNAAASAPAISSLSVAEGWRGAQITVVITGTNLNGANPAMGSTCTGVSFPTFTVDGATQITTSVLMSSTATAQTCAINVTTDAGASNNQTFTVRVPSKPVKASVF